MSAPFFPEVGSIPFDGPESDDPLAFRWYDRDRVVLGKTMADHLRFAVCYWHSFVWDGSDVFGAGTFDRPWIAATDPMDGARQKLDAAFEFFGKLGVDWFCFHDRDLAPEASDFASSCRRLDELAEVAAEAMDETGVGLLWGTANLFSHPRYAAGAATNPNPEVFAHAAAQVRHCLDVTHRLGGQNYVLWGGREGYETLLNTDLRREADQLARFLHLVADHKASIGFDGLLLLEPKPQEPTKHQYDYDAAAVDAFLQRYDLSGEYFVNLEVNHATLGGHDFHHEVVTSLANGTFGSIDANRGDDRLGWDTDQFPNSVEGFALPMYEIIRSGGFTTGGFNFDTKLRRQSLARDDLFHAHIGAMDTIAKSLLVAERLITDGELAARVDARYAAWSGELGSAIMDGTETLGSLHDRVASENLDPPPTSGRQEELENLVNRAIERIT
ncbi:MAG TPA: xylose isomerase [Acidimicrobiales bacterium]|nr:xylose isomerase [Acidimicrobiales bacterium]